MTLIICEAMGDQAFIMCDSIITKQGSTAPHVETPLGDNLMKFMPPDIYYHSFVGTTQKFTLIDNRICIAWAGVLGFGLIVVKKLGNQVNDIKSIENLRKFFHIQSDELGSMELIMCGLFKFENTYRLFKYDFESRAFSGNEQRILVGSGTALGDRLCRASEKNMSAGEKFLTTAALLYGREETSPEPAHHLIGGGYSGVIYKDGVFLPPPNATFLLWTADIDLKTKQILGQLPPTILNQKNFKGKSLTRTMKPQGGMSSSGHAEMKMKWYATFDYTTAKDLSDDEVKSFDLSFSEEFYLTTCNIASAKGAVDWCCLFLRDDPTCPFYFSRDDSGFNGIISEDFYLDSIDLAVNFFSQSPGLLPSWPPV